MPRIDPASLLCTLKQLLSTKGGIKSAEEVPRIVKLMQKFSKKLVSKCIYVHILRASDMDLLELFLQQKGWDLLNHWFLESINTLNWFLCGDLVKLFAVCPMNPARLKENVDVNQAPKLIRQLSTDPRLDEGIKSEAQQVLQQWMSVIRAPSQPSPAPSSRVTASPEKAPVSPTDAGALHGSDDDWQPEEEKSKPFSKKISMMKKKEGDRNSATDSSVDVDDLLGGDTSSDDEDENCAIKKKKEEIERRRKEREEKKAKEEEREKKKALERKEKSKLGYSKSELGGRGTVNNAEKERIKEVAKKLKQEAEQKGNRGKVETSSKQESTKSEAAPPAIERKSSITAGLGRIPKKEKPKDAAPSFSDLLGGLDVQKPKTIIKNKNKDLMDSLLNTSGSPTKSSKKEDRDGGKRDEKKRSRDSLESRAREKEDRLKEKEERSNKEKEERFTREKEEARSREKEERHKQKEERRSSLTGKEEKSPKEKEKHRERSSKSEERNGAKEGTLKVRPNLVMPTEKERRSKEKETSPVTTPDAKKSPKVIKESNMFMDVLGDIMKEAPKKKKRRLSEVKAEREAKEEEAKKLKKDQEDVELKASTSSGSDEEKSEETSAMDDDDLPFAEPLRELPREVRGILVLVKGKKAKRKIQWEPESSLVKVKLFEMDETERENVWKTKSFEEMRKQELARERQAGTGMKGSQMEEEDGKEDKEEKDWRMRPIAFQDQDKEAQVLKIWDCYGRDSKEKEVQLEREGRVLKSLFFNNLPTDPTEPDIGDRGGDPRAAIKDIPGEDQSGESGEGGSTVEDHSMAGWPAPTSQDPATTTFDRLLPQGNAPPAVNGLPANISAILQAVQDPALQGMLGASNVNAPPPTLKPEEAELYQQQLAAATALAQKGDLPAVGVPVHLPPPNFNQGYDGPRGGYQNNHHNHHMDRPPPGYDGHNRGHHNNFNNRSQSERWVREDNRGGFKANNFKRDARRDDRRGGGFSKRPCKFWMEKGRCKAEDSCLYPHPGR